MDVVLIFLFVGGLTEAVAVVEVEQLPVLVLQVAPRVILQAHDGRTRRVSDAGQAVTAWVVVVLSIVPDAEQLRRLQVIQYVIGISMHAVATETGRGSRQEAI